MSDLGELVGVVAAPGLVRGLTAAAQQAELKNTPPTAAATFVAGTIMRVNNPSKLYNGVTSPTPTDAMKKSGAATALTVNAGRDGRAWYGALRKIGEKASEAGLSRATLGVAAKATLNIALKGSFIAGAAYTLAGMAYDAGQDNKIASTAANTVLKSLPTSSDNPAVQSLIGQRDTINKDYQLALNANGSTNSLPLGKEVSRTQSAKMQEVHLARTEAEAKLQEFTLDFIKSNTKEAERLVAEKYNNDPAAQKQAMASLSGYIANTSNNANSPTATAAAPAQPNGKPTESASGTPAVPNRQMAANSTAPQAPKL